MLSRAADSLYWMSRYLERAEHTARVLDVQLSLMLERSTGSDDAYWVTTLRSLGMETDTGGDAYALVRSLIHEGTDPSSITACITSARENARQVRELISTEMWEQLNRLFHSVRTHSKGGDPREFLASVKAGSHLDRKSTRLNSSH